MRLLSLVLCVLSPLLGTKMTGSLDAPVATLQGIDVSHYQQKIDWQTVVEKNDLQFAFVKATEGSDFRDSLFCSNWTQLQQFGIRRGAYHYFRSYGCGFEQALHFMENVKLAPGDLAPVLDLETTDNMPTEIMLEEAQIWMQTIERSLNVRPILYTNQAFYEKYLVGVFDQHPLWIARYSNAAPQLKDGSIWNFWQYSHEGRLDGIPQHVDLNVFRGTPEMLDRLCWFPAEALPMPLDPAAAP
jgi:lysozyme